ncbi:MAG: hypothetical protein LKE45_09180 [Olsenella sp.]|jgi:hypothetical protein|nr:hypothetical protein [Olsenella sp.]
MSDDGERLSNEELAYSYAEHIRPDFDAEEIEGVGGDTTRAEAGAKGTADDIRTMMGDAKSALQVDAEALKTIADDFEKWDERYAHLYAQ